MKDINDVPPEIQVRILLTKMIGLSSAINTYLQCNEMMGKIAEAIDWKFHFEKALRDLDETPKELE